VSKLNTSKLFKNAIINLYKSKIYTVDFAILKASDYADKNKINANDYEELIKYLAEEQEKQMVEEQKENTIQKWKVKEIEEVG
jgi:hypothetical protein